MPARKKRNRKPGKAGRIALWALAGLAALLLALTGVAALNAARVNVRRAEVWLPDLPGGFDGATILYACDLDLCGINTPERCAALFDQLRSLNPDMMVLGGGYTSSSVWETLNRAETSDDATRQLKNRTSFFYYIRSFSAPLGKFAIAAPDDPDRDGLALLMQESGIVPLFNRAERVRRDGDEIVIAGMSADTDGLSRATNVFRRGECVIAVAPTPSLFPAMLTAEAADGGMWTDMVLSGGTHGGQINLFGATALTLDRWERQYLSGWFTENGLPVLVSEGVGCEGANLRLGSQAEVWLITMRRPTAE